MIGLVLHGRWPEGGDFVKEEKEIENLTLLLIYLTSWDENPKKRYGDRPIIRAWKGYNFAVLDRLQEKGLITFTRGAKSVYLTENGVKRARETGKLGRDN
ncbi:hypothetical protein AKJ65_04535 [candidate division MSBL1 archaeon SCGC-AAA259E19]|uniref:DUF6429 domain-containing protein n=1 Tax=candidate division MSBL1 archaeon SCGC-AAA259E19 TaxID=1698264 RepID=A0A133UJJ3_9EURY|nr:hypothetical protein AKJ65_04535 [candidate division MSBL1 archaeon SCGC-AAA259E19]